MDSRILLIVSSFVATINTCEIYEQVHIFYNISELGIAALKNDVEAVDSLLFNKVVYYLHKLQKSIVGCGKTKKTNFGAPETMI